MMPRNASRRPSYQVEYREPACLARTLESPDPSCSLEDSDACWRGTLDPVHKDRRGKAQSRILTSDRQIVLKHKGVQTRLLILTLASGAYRLEGRRFVCQCRKNCIALHQSPLNARVSANHIMPNFHSPFEKYHRHADK